MSVTKQQLTETVYNLTKLSKRESAEMVDFIFEEIKMSLHRGEDVKLSGFGKFDVKSKHERKGRNPQTGEAIAISARKIVTFKPSASLKAKVNA